MDKVADILTILLSSVYLFSGITKIFGVKKYKDNFKRWGYSYRFMVGVGGMETSGAIAFFLGIWYIELRFIAVCWLAAIMLGALFTHIRAKDAVTQIMLPLVLLALTLATPVI